MLSEVHNRYVAKELLASNERTAIYGIVLSEQDCKEIAECRSQLLMETERIEIGTGAARRIIEEFCDCSYVDPRNFKDTVAGLLECFYTIKNETEDTISDDKVLRFIRLVFETEAGGDVAAIYNTDAFETFIRTGTFDYVAYEKKLYQ